MIATELAKVLQEEKVSRVLQEWLDKQVVDMIKSVPAEKLGEKLEHVMRPPISFQYPHVLDWMTARWVAEQAVIFGELGITPDARVLEIASGDQLAVPLAVECYSQGLGSYMTANLNKRLTERFVKAAARLSINMEVIEADGARIGEYVPRDTFHAVVFLHAVNDIIQTIVADQINLDTIHTDWFEILPAMVKEMAIRDQSGTLEDSVKEPFLAIIKAVVDVVKPGGVMIFTHWEYEYDLNLGYPPELYRSFIPLARSWLSQSGLSLEEVTPPGFDPQYRMVLRKSGPVGKE
ncbi:MAG: hypothetical protein K0R57_1057 [Paenibacillaceae bacterium]|jgi:hypothetical protein|nr:hypothetical protein [Paenibacillaceae bacterium]